MTLKVDVEGLELNVLRGMLGSLETGLVKRGVVDIDEENLKCFDSGVDEIYAYMENFGFSSKYQNASLSHYDEIFSK